MQRLPHKEGSLLVHLLEFVELAKVSPPCFTYPPYMGKERLQPKYSWTLARLNKYNSKHKINNNKDRFENKVLSRKHRLCIIGFQIQK